jgi:hypothetical protein
MEKLQSPIGNYAPSDLQKMQAGKAHVDSSGGFTTVTFDDSYKQGDKLSLAFDTAAKKIRSYDVNTYLDDVKDVVTLNSVCEPDRRHELPAGCRFGRKEQTDSNQYHKGEFRPIEPLSQD